MRTYSGLILLSSFEDRFRYLKLDGIVGTDTFGFDRWINQKLYKSGEWQQVRDYVIVRDNGLDLGVKDHDIVGSIYVHHMMPLRVEDVIDATEYLLNPEYLISCSKATHDAIHFGDVDSFLQRQKLVERRPNDTALWRRR